jgi:hypothetical protein
MHSLTLTAQELFYLAAHLGAQTLFGLPDPFFGMEEDEIARELVAIQLALTKKSYATMGFDDAFALKEGVSRLVEVCAHCDRYLTADFDFPDGRQTSLLYYGLGSQAAELLAEEDMLVLRWIDGGDIPRRVWTEMDWPPEEAPEPPGDASGSPPWAKAQPFAVAGDIAYADITRAHKLAEEDTESAASHLINAGCPEALARVLLNGFQKKSGYYAVCAADMDARTMEHGVYIAGASGAVAIRPLDEYEEEKWSFAPVDASAVQASLRGLCRGWGNSNGADEWEKREESDEAKGGAKT